jgi:hypothetical protein
MLRRFSPKLWAVLVAGLATTLVLTSPAQSADKKTKQQFENWARSINAQNPAIQIDAWTNHAITGFARSPYQRTLARPTGYRALMISPRLGGVIIGRDPASIGRGKVEPIGIPKFEYKLLPEVEGKPRRVNLRFWLAKDVKNENPSWEFEVSAAVITPMTAAALDGRLGLFTLTAADEEGKEVGAAVHPALQGHKIAYRPALLDLFAEVDEIAMLKVLPAEERAALVRLALADPDLAAADRAKIREKLKQPLRLADETVKKLFEQKLRNVKENSFTLSAVVEKPWRLEEDGLKAVEAGADPSKAAFKFVHRIVYKEGEGKYNEIPISGQVNKEVFASLTDTEKQLVKEYNEALIVHRIVYWVKQEKIVNFDRDQNWSRMIDELGDIYKANLDKSIDADALADAAAKWADEYTGKDRGMPAKMKLK